MKFKKKQKFVRVGFTQYSKLGLRRKKKQVYRKAMGTDNKVRLNMKGHLRNVRAGFRNPKATRDLILGLKPILISSVSGLKNIKQGELPIVAKIGNKRKLEIAKYALENKIRLHNLNSAKFIKKIEEEIKNRKELKSKRNEKLKDRERKAKEAEKKKDEKKTEGEKKENTETKVEETKTEEVKEEKNESPKTTTKKTKTEGEKIE